MRSRGHRLRLLGLLVTGSLLLNNTPANAAAHQQIQGTGSSWATNAINVWVAGVTPSGLQVVFTSTGSAQGRKDFGNSTTDFGVSDIGYQGRDSRNGDIDLPCKLGSSTDCRPYAYLPIVSGGTAFAYHLEVGGNLIRNLRLSGRTLAGIFTGNIRSWDDPAITADNHGKKLPKIPVIPIVHAEGSGSSAQFTSYLDNQFPSIWRAYAPTPGMTEYFPVAKNMIAQNGSDQVINYITSAAANGTIGYDEYSYALSKNYPVAKIENSFGNFTLPTQFNVAVALTKAEINLNKNDPNYLLQKLDKVYTYSDPRTYPLSSYSYGIIPTAATDSRLNTAKRQTLADFLYYSVCQGQAQIGPVGYSALPLNLVQASFDQIGKLKAADPGVDLTARNVTTCNNPTFVPGDLTRNRLAEIAPAIPACDNVNSDPCVGAGNNGTSGIPTNSGSGSGGGSSTSGSGNSGGLQGTANRLKPGGSAGRTIGAAKPSAASSGAAINPDTGLPVDNSGSGTGGTVVGQPTALADYRQPNMTNLLALLAASEMLGALVLPPLVYFYWIRPRRRRTS
jgi:ABC-type phosphate transport system substrate-binding protein